MIFALSFQDHTNDKGLKRFKVIYYFEIEAVPHPDNPEAQEMGGAYVNCWINFPLADGAEMLAKFYIEQNGWIPGQVLERGRATREGYQNYPEHLPYFEEAEADGTSCIFNCWDINAKDSGIPTGAL